MTESRPFRKNKKTKMEEKVFLGGIAVIHRNKDGRLEFLVVENAKTKNITFVSGAKEDSDESETDAINREIQEELGLLAGEIKFRPTGIRHEFIFGPSKKDRTGQRGSYEVFLADATNMNKPINHTTELKDAKWMSEEEVMNKLSFPDLKEVFLKVAKNLHAN